jgi:hypothetical protein
MIPNWNLYLLLLQPKSLGGVKGDGNQAQQKALEPLESKGLNHLQIIFPHKI